MCVCMCMGNYESVENALNVVIAIVQGASVLRRECSTWTTSSAGWEYQQRVATRMLSHHLHVAITGI